MPDSFSEESSVFRSTEDSGQRPEILISHNSAEVFFGEQEGSGDPALP
jgi:hypothetical protein